MTYAGLTTADKGALLKAKECGGSTYSRWATIGDKWVRELTVNIDLALAQIAEMESKQNNALSEKASEKGCLTWNERINQMSADEKGEFFATFNCIESIQPGYDCSQHENCKECMIAFFASPYTEGANQ